VVDGPNPVNRLELPKFKEARRKRATVAAEDVPRVLAALTPEWRPLFATAFFLGMRRGELLALQKEDIDLREWTMTVRRSGDADVTKGGDEGTVPIPEPLRPYIDAAIKLSPSRWVFPAADGTQRATDTNLKAVPRRALGRAGIVEGYEHRCRKPGCGHVECADDSANRRCPTDGRALWIRPLPKKGIVFHSLRHTTATLLARAKVHPSVAQKILRHANIETTLAIYTHLDGIEDMRAAVAKLDFGPLEERAPAPVVPLRKEATFGTRLLPATSPPKDEAPDRPGNARKIRGLQESGATGFEPATTCTPSAAEGITTVLNDSQALVITGNGDPASVQPSQRFAEFSRNFAANLLPDSSGGIERLLTVRQVAELLGVCAARVYKWAADGVLPHVRMVNVIRVRPRDLAQFIERR